MQLSLALDCNSVKLLLAFGAGPLCESSYDLGLKKSGPCPESRIGMLSESNWKNSGLVKMVRITGWSALWGRPIPVLHCTYKFTTVDITRCVTLKMYQIGAAIITYYNSYQKYIVFINYVCLLVLNKTNP